LSEKTITLEAGETKRLAQKTCKEVVDKDMDDLHIKLSDVNGE